jgi:hypothetical protein
MFASAFLAGSFPIFSAFFIPPIFLHYLPFFKDPVKHLHGKFKEFCDEALSGLLASNWT